MFDWKLPDSRIHIRIKTKKKKIVAGSTWKWSWYTTRVIEEFRLFRTDTVPVPCRPPPCWPQTASRSPQPRQLFGDSVLNHRRLFITQIMYEGKVPVTITTNVFSGMGGGVEDMNEKERKKCNKRKRHDKRKVEVKRVKYEGTSGQKYGQNVL
jgi:hypothetical protein